MLLYKNVDICDLPSIIEKGIMSMDGCGNNNWDDGKRSKNATNVVYLFKPISKENSFPKYGAALIEVDVPDAKQSQMSSRDVNCGKYEEYIVEKVPVECIKNIYVPGIFKDRINLNDDVVNLIKWCDLRANTFFNASFCEATSELLERFAKTAPIECANAFNFFRGIREDRTMIDLYDISYVWENK